VDIRAQVLREVVDVFVVETRNDQNMALVAWPLLGAVNAMILSFSRTISELRELHHLLSVPAARRQKGHL